LLPATVVRVVDGDTAVFALENGTEEKVRFIGVDTPESTTEIEVYGKEASSYTSKTLSVGTQVWLEKDVEERDKYGRLLAYVWLSQPSALSDAEIRAKMFNARLALDGYAQQMTIQPNSKYAEYFTTYVAEARTAEMGLWNPELIAVEKPAPKPKVAAPSPTPSASYIGNKNTKKFHFADCGSVNQMNPSNKVPISSREKAISLGYVPCKNCDP
jgi:micrococcal nuclease